MPDDIPTLSPDANCNALKTAEPYPPTWWYYDIDHYTRELDAIWLRSWLYVCRSAELAEPRMYQTIRIGDQNIVILRGYDGELRAFHNACRHRGSLLCTEQKGKLVSKLLVCPYHQWSYAADDGHLVKISSFAEPQGFNKEDYSLFPVAVGEWRGCVFINLDADAEWTLEAAFVRTPATIANYPLETMVVGHTWCREMDCNWKTFWENFSECLHCPNVHPELGELVPQFKRRVVHFKDQPGWEDHQGSGDPLYTGGLADGVETWSMDGSAQGHVIEGRSSEDIERGYSYATTLPSAFIGAYPDHVRIVRLMPMGPEKTQLVAEWLFEPETLNAPDYDPANVIDFGILVMEQDMAVCDLNQAGLHAKPMDAGVLMPEEYYIKAIHDWIRTRLDP